MNTVPSRTLPQSIALLDSIQWEIKRKNIANEGKIFSQLDEISKQISQIPEANQKIQLRIAYIRQCLEKII